MVRGTCEERVKLLFRLLDRDMDKAIRASELRPFVSHMLEAAAKIARAESLDGETNARNPSTTTYRFFHVDFLFLSRRSCADTRG